MSSKSRLIVLTGATRGLGRSLIPHFIEAGHTIIGCGRNADDVAKLSQEFGKTHHFAVVDVVNESQVLAWAAAVQAQAGVPDLLINNAAVMNPLGCLWELPSADFNKVIEVNVIGVVNVIRAFVPKMVERKTGVIVNLSSGWGRSTSPEVAPYCASKYAIEGLSLAMAQELPSGMASIPLNPGIIDTDMLRSAWGDSAGSYPTADLWAKRAAPFILNLTSKNNGRSLTVS